MERKQVSVFDRHLFVLQEAKGPITAARYNWNDSYIAAGSETGEIILHNTITGQSSSPLLAATAQVIMKYYHTLQKFICLLSSKIFYGNFCSLNCQFYSNIPMPYFKLMTDSLLGRKLHSMQIKDAHMSQLSSSHAFKSIFFFNYSFLNGKSFMQ